MTIGIALIGSGRAGLIHARNVVHHIPQARLVAVADPVADLRTAACIELGCEAAYADYAKALADRAVDAVVIATPTAFHKDICVAAAEAGKHVFCEKPMAMNVDECDAMIEACQRHGVKLQIGFMRRFDAGFLDAHRRIQAGEIGRVVQVKSHTHGPSTPRPWMYDLTKSNGPLAEVNSHDIDTLHWFTASAFTEVYAIGGNFRCPEARAKWPDFYDNVTVVARFANGMQGIIGGAQGVRYGYDSRCEVLGEHGLITVGRLEAPSVRSHTAAGTRSPIVGSWTDLFIDAYRAEDAHFIDCIAHDRDPAVTGQDGRMAVAVVEAGNRSIREQKPVAISFAAVTA